MIPFRPEPLLALRKRLAGALDRTILTPEVAANPAATPGKDRRHVFDFADGCRLIVSVDSGIGLHVSASYVPDTALERRLKKAVRAAGPAAGADRLRREGADAWRRLAGPEVALEFVGFSPDLGIPHWRADPPQTTESPCPT